MCTLTTLADMWFASVSSSACVCTSGVAAASGADRQLQQRH